MNPVCTSKAQANIFSYQNKALNNTYTFHQHQLFSDIVLRLACITNSDIVFDKILAQSKDICDIYHTLIQATNLDYCHLQLYFYYEDTFLRK